MEIFADVRMGFGRIQSFLYVCLMEHILDNPAWSALISGNKNLSLGNEQIKYFDEEVSPFVAFNENTAANFRALYNLLPHSSPVLFVAPVETEIPSEWEVLKFIRGQQMVCDGEPNQEEIRCELVSLTSEHVPQMYALAKLTNPGPFESRTIEFGHYYGIFDNDQLVAMAGQRLHPFNYAEVSAVCTRPDHTGKGYARQLILNQIRRIRAVSKIPFLHVRVANERAIKVYKDLGFSTRINVYFYYMQKQGSQ